MYIAETNPCIEARLLMNFFFGCIGWGKHALDIDARGSLNFYLLVKLLKLWLISFALTTRKKGF
jgi:hypothetical protein